MHLDYIDFNNKTKTFALSHRKTVGHSDMPSNHFHNSYEIYYLLSGKRYYFIKDKTYLINKGDLVFINPYDLHKTTDAGCFEHERILLGFTKEFIMPSAGLPYDILTLPFSCSSYVLTTGINEQKYFEGLLFKMIQEAQNKISGFEVYLHTLLTQLLIYAGRYIEQNQINQPEHPSAMHQKVSEIVQYINQHYMEQLTLSSLSRQFFISPYYLSRIFKEVTGFTFIEYLNSTRIKEAQKFLRESKLKITLVAERVGFESIAHFGRVFKKVSGLSPLHYRKISLI